MLFYRGSLSGKNRHARWIVCEDCKVRLEYTPAFGATGHHRQAGPLNNDTAETLRRGGTGKELKAKTVAIEGAERSLELRLAQVKAMREEESQKKDYSKKDMKQPWKPERQKSPEPATVAAKAPSVPIATLKASSAGSVDAPMHTHPSRKLSKPAETTKMTRPADVPVEERDQSWEDLGHQAQTWENA